MNRKDGEDKKETIQVYVKHDKNGSFSVLNIEEDVSKIESSVDRANIFRKMKRKIIDLEAAVHNVNDILQK